MGHFKPGRYCYLALFEKDSAMLSFAVDAYGSVAGKLCIKYGKIKPKALEHEINSGNITGGFKDDTLIADWVFTSGHNRDILYQNPVAIMHKGDSLIMGSGRIMSYLGRNYFDEKAPIDFARSRFRFKPINCK